MIQIDKLKDLSSVKQSVFAYLTCERLYPNYIYFSANYNFGTPPILRGAIDYLYLNIFEINPNKNQITFLIKEVDTNTPDPGEFDTILASSALDACSAIFETLNFLIDKKFQRIKDISTFATDTVHMYIQDIESLDFNTDKAFQKKIDSHPLMIKEVSIQHGIIDFLLKSKDVDYDDIKTLYQLQEGNKMGSLEL